MDGLCRSGSISCVGMIEYIWLVFTVLFAVLSCYHFYRSFQLIKEPARISGIKSINGASTGLVETNESLANYVKQLNRENRIMNRITATGYMITAATALFSYFLV